MAGRIAGITIEIDGNTSKLQSSLKGLDGSLRKTQSTLKDVDKLLKLDPGNTELLTQKQKNLETAIRGTKLRLNELKNAQEGVAEGSEEWDALQREIIATEQDLKGLNKEYRDFGSVGAQQVAAVGQAMQDVGSKIEGVGQSLTKALSVPIVGAFLAAAKTTADFDSAMSQVAATMGTTVDEIQDLSDFAREMGATTAFSATEAAEALNYMALAGYDAETSMKMLPTVLNLAAAGGISLASASDMVTDAQSALGLSIEETAVMVDQMAAASSKTNTSVEQLGSAFLTIGATARGVSGGTQELATVLGVLADNGIKGAEGGTHLRNILLSLQSSAENGKVMFGDLAVSVYDADGNMRSMVDIIGDVQAGLGGMSQESKDAILSGVFNKTDLAAVNALLGTSADRFDELAVAIGDSGGAAGKMADTQLDNLKGDITLLKSAVEGLAISFGKILVPYIRNGVSWVQKVVDKFNALSPATKEVAVKIAAVVAAIAPMLIVGGKLVSGIGKVLTFAPMIKTAITGVTAALASPIGVIALVAAAAVALGVVIYKNWDKIKAWTLGLVENIKAGWEGLKTAAAEKWEAIKASVVEKVEGIKTAVIEKWETLKADVAAKAEEIKAAAVEKWEGLKESVSQVVTNIKTDVYLKWTALKSLISSTVENIKASVVEKWEAMKSTVADVANNIHDTAVEKWEALKESVSAAAEALKTSVTQAWGRLKSAVTTAVNTTKANVTNAWNNAKSTVVSTVQGLQDAIQNKWNAIKSSTVSVVSGIVSSITSKFRSAWSTVTSIFGNIQSSISSKINAAKDAVSRAIEAIKGFFNFTFSWPHIPLPHFSITPEGWKVGDLLRGTIPSLGITWYRKAYDNPMLFKQPTVLQTPQGLKGFGDGHGAEIVLGLNKLRELVGSSGNQVTINVYPPAGANVEQIAAAVEQRLVAAQQRRIRVYA